MFPKNVGEQGQLPMFLKILIVWGMWEQCSPCSSKVFGEREQFLKFLKVFGEHEQFLNLLKSVWGTETVPQGPQKCFREHFGELWGTGTP